MAAGITCLKTESAMKIEIEPFVIPDPYIGGCPHCGKWDHPGLGYYWYRWNICEKHQVKWQNGDNEIHPDYDKETPEIWEANVKILAECTSVVPSYGADDYAMILDGFDYSFEPDLPEQIAEVRHIRAENGRYIYRNRYRT
jgi:hypothetical protein